MLLMRFGESKLRYGAYTATFNSFVEHARLRLLVTERSRVRRFQTTHIRLETSTSMRVRPEVVTRRIVLETRSSPQKNLEFTHTHLNGA